LVKGLVFDPVGKYLASQSDDKTLRIWKTSDWSQDAVIEKPFHESGGTTSVLRLTIYRAMLLSFLKSTTEPKNMQLIHF